MIVIMKRLFQVFALLVIPEMLCAQGTVDFRNKVIGGVDAPIYNPITGMNVSGPDIVGQLYFSRTADGPFQSVSDPPAPLRTGVGAGYWNPGASSTRILVGITSGDTVWLQVRVWNGRLFATYEGAVSQGGAVGLSNVFPVNTGGAGNPPVLPATLTGLEPIPFIPEPATVSLAILGGLMMILLCRRVKG